MASRTNGYAEQSIKRLSEGIIRHSTPEIDDRYIEQLLPIIQISILATTNEMTKISPYEVLHGFPMPLPSPITGDEPIFLSKDAESYAKWLKVSLKLLHTAVYKNRIESKQQMKKKYNKRHKVKEPDFKTGQKVLLLDRRIKPDSNRVLVINHIQVHIL